MTGTTTVGITYKDGIVLAADRRATAGHLIASKTAKKIYKIANHIGITTAGGVADTQNLGSVLKAEAVLFKLKTSSDISLKSISTLTSNILHSNRMFPLLAQILLGGVDSSGVHVFMLDPFGAQIKDKYLATGSGSLTAYGVLEDSYKDEMTEKVAANLAIRSVLAAQQRDSASGNGLLVVNISKKGYTELSDSAVEKYIE